jgi:hypothetical protein
VTRGREHSKQDDADSFAWAVTSSGIARLPAFWRGHGYHRSWSPIRKEHERCQLFEANPLALTRGDGGLSAGKI